MSEASLESIISHMVAIDCVSSVDGDKFLALARESEGAADMLHLWLEASLVGDLAEQDACEREIRDMIADREPPPLGRTRRVRHV